MLIGYGAPSSISWVASGVGAAFVSEVLLNNAVVTETTRLRWLSSGSPAVGQYVELQALWDTPQTVRVLAVLGLQELTGADSPLTYTAPARLPAGVRVEVFGRRLSDPGFTYDLGGNSQSERTKRLPNGSTAAAFIFDEDAEELVGLAVRIYNDASGVTWADATTYLDIGEIPFRAAVDVCGAPGVVEQLVLNRLTRQTMEAQTLVVSRRPARRVRVDLTAASLAETRGEALEDGMDLQMVEAALADTVPAILVPWWKGQDGTFSSQELHRSLIYGYAEPEPIAHVQNSPANRRQFVTGYTVTELPPL